MELMNGIKVYLKETGCMEGRWKELPQNGLQ
jgi:hypothetical protein